MQMADEKMVFFCNNLLQATCTGLSDVACCWLMYKLTPSPWCLAFIPCKLWLLKKKHWLMKLNIKMQKQKPQYPHCLQCVCSGLFSCRTQLRLLRRAKWIVFVIQFILGFQCCQCLREVVPEDLERVRLGVYYMVSGTAQKQLPKVSLKEKERILHGGVKSVWTWRHASTCLQYQSADCKSSDAGVDAFGLLGCISPLS